MEEDIEDVLKRADHYRFEEEPDTVPLNRISTLPTSKKQLRKAILERIDFLIGNYMSLATFVPDELVDWLNTSPNPSRARKVYLRVFDDMQRLKLELLEQITK